ncbi:hypothetical protein ACWED2_10095 [Amycolatopsis sp. NPDC005003]
MAALKKRWISRWPHLLIVASSLLVVLSARFAFGPSDWAGLGQWAGGFGAFYAAVVALQISGREAKDRAKAEAHQDFVRANMVVCYHQNGVVVISNRSREPVNDVLLTGYHLEGTRHAVASEVRHLLLPSIEPHTLPFEYKPGHGMSTDEALGLIERGAEFEFEFTDLHENRWTRRGDHAVRRKQT